MNDKKIKKRDTRGSGSVLEKAVFAIAIGLLFLLLPWFFSASPGIEDISVGLRLPGWLSLGIGLVLLAVHRARKGQTPSENDQMPRSVQDDT